MVATITQFALIAPLSMAQDEPAKDRPINTSASDILSDSPASTELSLELLQYLAEFSAADGKMIDPETMQPLSMNCQTSNTDDSKSAAGITDTIELHLKTKPEKSPSERNNLKYRLYPNNIPCVPGQNLSPGDNSKKNETPQKLHKPTIKNPDSREVSQ